MSDHAIENYIDDLSLNEECTGLCRSAVISKCVEQNPEDLEKPDENGNLPLHSLLWNEASTTEDALMLIEKYPEALQHQNIDLRLPLLLECMKQCRSTIILKCIELFPESLAKSDMNGYLPLHSLLWNETSAASDALILMEKYSAALQHQIYNGRLPLHIECMKQCRSSILLKCIELYPEALAKSDKEGFLPLHWSLCYGSTSVDTAMMLIEKYPDAVKHRITYPPLHIECKYKCRATVIAKCIELYPEALEDKAIVVIIEKVNPSTFQAYSSVLSVIFAARPMSLYDRNTYTVNDIRLDPAYRRQILHLLPRYVFTPWHTSDYRQLNWQPRAAMMMFLSLMKVQQQTSKATVMLVDSLTSARSRGLVQV
jgi:hypothetical protein